MASTPVPAPPLSPPRCFALILMKYSNDTSLYLHTLHADVENTIKFGELEAQQPIDSDDGNDDGSVLTNPQARFFFERSKKVEGYQHVRCGYNNKYWVPEKPAHPNEVVMAIGITPEREEDMTKESCTLFKVQLRPNTQDAAGNNIYDASFYDINGKRAFIYSTNEIHGSFLIRDLSDHVVLPRHVAFKGDNGKYLSARQVHGRSYCQFSSQDITDPSVRFTTFHNNDGTVRIKSNAYNQFLRLSPSWIWPDGQDSPDDKNIFFKVTKIDDYYLLKSLGNQRFCKRLTADNKSDCLNAGIDHVTPEAKLWVEEPVLSREIYNVVYHGLDKARVYDSKTIKMATSSAINDTTKDNNVKLSLTTTETNSKEWDKSISAKVGFKSTITASVPEVGGASEEWSVEVESGFSFGKTEVTETKQEVVYEMVVPTKKKVTLSAVATQAKCDIPYSYTQKDIMPSGEVIISTLHDGMYRGKNTFNLQYVTKEENMPAESAE